VKGKGKKRKEEYSPQAWEVQCRAGEFSSIANTAAAACGSNQKKGRKRDNGCHFSLRRKKNLPGRFVILPTDFSGRTPMKAVKMVEKKLAEAFQQNGRQKNGLPPFISRMCIRLTDMLGSLYAEIKPVHREEWRVSDAISIPSPRRRVSTALTVGQRRSG